MTVRRAHAVLVVGALALLFSGGALGQWGSRPEKDSPLLSAGLSLTEPSLAVDDETVQRVLIFGGSHQCADTPGCPDPYVRVWYHDSIFRFNPDPASYEVVVDGCLSLPTDREGTSAVWRQFGGESLIFGGSTGALTTWNGYGEVVRYEA